MPRDLDSIRAGIARFEAEQAERSKQAAAMRGKRAMPPLEIDGRRRAAMRRVISETLENDPPPCGSPRHVRLTILGASLRELAKRAELSHSTVDRAERGFEAGNPHAVSGPSLRKLAAALERSTGRRVKITDVRAPRADA